jgi:hypothetical protein
MIWFAAFLSLIVIYYGLTAYLIEVLKANHPETYELLERPLPFWNDHRTTNLLVWLCLGEYRTLPNNSKKSPFVVARLVAFSAILVFLGFLATLFSS